MILQTIWRRVVGNVFINISASNIYLTMIFYARFHKNCSTAFGLLDCDFIHTPSIGFDWFIRPNKNLVATDVWSLLGACPLRPHVSDGHWDFGLWFPAHTFGWNWLVYQIQSESGSYHWKAVVISTFACTDNCTLRNAVYYIYQVGFNGNWLISVQEV